jgi:hypothetical protein
MGQDLAFQVITDPYTNSIIYQAKKIITGNQILSAQYMTADF